MKAKRLPGGENMKDRRKGERRSFTWDRKLPDILLWNKERRQTIIKAGRRVDVEDRRSEDNYFCYKERRKK